MMATDVVTRVTPDWQTDEARIEWHCAIDEAVTGLTWVHTAAAVLAADYGDARDPDSRFDALLNAIGKVAARLGRAHGEIARLLPDESEAAA